MQKKKKFLENGHIHSGQGKKYFLGEKLKSHCGQVFLFVCLFGGVSSINLIESRLGAGGNEGSYGRRPGVLTRGF